MSLKLIIGRSYEPREEFMYNEIADILNKEPDSNIFYLVPEHITFDSELNMLNALHQHPHFEDRDLMGMIRLQVFSIERLAWYLLQDQPVYQRPQLTSTGMNMMLQQIIKENENDLKIFNRQVHEQGFIEKLTHLFTEFRQGNILPETLDEMMAELDVKEDEETSESADFYKKNLLVKLEDLSILYDKFMTRLDGNYIEKEDIIEALIDKVKSESWKDTYIYFNHFDSFTAQEMELIEACMKQAEETTVGLTLNKPYPNNPPQKNELFYQTGLTYHRIFSHALENNIEIETINCNDYSENNIETSDTMAALEQYWVDSSENMGQVSEKDTVLVNGLEIWEAENRQAEVIHTATEIRKLVYEEGYRFQDIMVFARNIEEYSTIIPSIFAQNNISVFVDEADLMANHPLVEFVQSLFLVYQNNWRQEDILRLLKTDLLLPIDPGNLPSMEGGRSDYIRKESQKFRNKVDLTENVVLANGYMGEDWYGEEDWIYTKFKTTEEEEQKERDKIIQDVTNEVRRQVRDILMPFFNQLDRSETNKEAARYFYMFLEKYHVNDVLLVWRDEAIEAEELEAGRKHEQIWEQFIRLLDEFVDLLGEEPFEVKSFLQLIEVGFEAAAYSIVPPTIDQVIFSLIDKEPAEKPKIAFILGLNDNSLPLQQRNDTLLSDEDREVIDDYVDEEAYIQEGSFADTANEPYVAYSVFTRATDKLYLSVPLKNNDNDELRISPYVERIKDHFDITMKEKKFEAHIDDPVSEEILDFIGSPKETMRQLVSVMRQGKDINQIPHPFWLRLLRIFANTYEEDPRFQRIMGGLDYSNIPEPLTQENAEALYGKNLYVSVTQLESFFEDPFSYFLKYGLRLEERDILDLTPLETGNFFHSALDALFKKVSQENLSLNKLSDSEIEDLTEEVLSELFTKRQFSILNKTNDMAFNRYLLSQTIKQMAAVFAIQKEYTPFNTEKTEVPFGFQSSKNNIAGFSHDLSKDRSIHLRGVIDRVESALIEDSLYLNVVDYKSSKQNFNIEDVYYGLDLQLLTYLFTALKNSKELVGKEAKPFGGFYYQIQNPFIELESKDFNLSDDKRKESIQNERIKQYKLNQGFIIDPKDDVDVFKDYIEISNYSPLYSMRYNKENDEIKLNGTTFSEEEFNILNDFLEAKIIEAGEKILNGITDLRPYDTGRAPNYTPSVRSPYKAISQFDALLKDNRYYPKSKKTIQDIEKSLRQNHEEEEKND